MATTLTAYDIIHKALRIVGVVGLGDPVDPLVSYEALMVLNGIRAEFSLNVKNWRKYDQTYYATANKQSITLGTNGLVPGDIATRPNTITDIILINGDATVNGTSNNNYKLDIKPYESYREQMVQNIFAMPETAYIDYEFPLMNIYLYPGLSAGWSLRVMGNSYMTEYENIGDQLVDPPEYFDAMYLALALKLAPMYGADVPTGVIIQAASAIKHIKHHLYNLRAKNMQNQMAGGTGFNFYAGR